jgi:hypothetical protein
MNTKGVNFQPSKRGQFSAAVDTPAQADPFKLREPCREPARWQLIAPKSVAACVTAKLDDRIKAVFVFADIKDFPDLPIVIVTSGDHLRPRALHW